MDTLNQHHKQLRLFISSTFIDMNSERDALTRVFPQIKELCEQRGVEFVPLDLRWGITEEAAKEGRVIETCLREIDDARPFFIGIIGHRYGWAPQVSDLGEYGDDLMQKYPWLEPAINEQMSITEMEMQHAALMNMNDEKMNAAFYIRSDKMVVDKSFKESAGSKEERKLNALKHKVRSQQRYAARDYDSIDQLAEMVLKDVTQFVDRAFPRTEVSSFDQDAELQERILNSRSKTLIPLQRYQLQIDKWLQEKAKRDILITGKSGVGKSYVLAHVVQQLRNKGEKVVYVDFSELESMRCMEYVTGEMLCQLGVKNRKQVEKSMMIGCLFSFIWKFIVLMFKSIFLTPFRMAFGSRDNAVKSISDDMTQVMSTLQSRTLVEQVKQVGKALAKKPNVVLYVALDNMDDLTGDDMSLYGVFGGTNQVRLLSSASLNSKTYAYVQSLPDTEQLEVQNMGIYQASSYVNNYLAQYGKMLDARGDQCGKLMRSGVAGNPMMMSHVLQLMVRFGSHEKLENYIYELSNIKNESELYGLMIKHILSQFDKAEQQKRVKEIIAIVAVAKDGLTENEIQDILKPQPMEWAMLRPYLFSICRCKDKRWKPVTEVCRKALLDALQDHRKWAVRELSSYYESSLKASILHRDKLGVVDNNKVMEDMRLLQRQVEVLPELYYENEQWEDLFLWATYVRGESFIKYDQRVRYWNALYRAGYSMRTCGDVDVPPYTMRQLLFVAKRIMPNVKKHECDQYLHLARKNTDWIESGKSERNAMFVRWLGIASMCNVGEDIAWVSGKVVETSDQDMNKDTQLLLNEYEVMVGKKEWDRIIERAPMEIVNESIRLFIDMFVTIAYMQKGEGQMAYQVAARNVKNVIRQGVETEAEVLPILGFYADLSCKHGTSDDWKLALELLEGHVGLAHTESLDSQNALLLHMNLANVHLKLGHKEQAISHAKILSRGAVSLGMSTQSADNIIQAANKL